MAAKGFCALRARVSEVDWIPAFAGNADLNVRFQIGEYALVLRRTRSKAALLSMSALGRAAVFGSRYCFLGVGVGLRFGQACRRGLCDIHRTTAADHLER